MRQIWLRHRRGSGKIYGNNADIDHESYLSRDSVIGDNVEVYASRIYSSILSDDVITGGALIENSNLSGQTRVINSQVHEVDLHNAKVFGNADLIGPWSLSAPDGLLIRLHGLRRRPPRFAEITDGNVRVIVSECHLPDHFEVGCWCRPWETWRTRGHAYGKVAGWAPELVDEALAAMAGWRNLPQE